MKIPVALFSGELFLAHVTPAGHPERPDRLRALLAHLDRSPVRAGLRTVPPTPATLDQVRVVHSAAYLERLQTVCAEGGGLLDEGDTHAVASSFDAAMLAAGACVGAVDTVLGREAPAAFCAVRPPGHHAERDRAMGFCLLNNAAVAARHAQRRHGLKKVAILDWDVHHGNGTQHAFEDDPSVLYISLHRYPFYPGTGTEEECGVGEGEGTTINFPLPAGTGEARYRELFERDIVPALEQYNPGLLIISAGFDAHRDDPLGGMNLREESFGLFTRLVMHIAPVVSVLEGGYDLNALGRSAEQHLAALGAT